jgi:hypothetical protein
VRLAVTWTKRTLVYCPSGAYGWDKQYAHLPTVWCLGGALLRIFFAALDEDRFGRIGYVDVDSKDPAIIVKCSPHPVLDLGEPGTFDDAGVNPACFVETESRMLLYYIGWQRNANVRAPYMLFAGVAETYDGQNFRRLSRTPILERTASEPFIRSAMSVIRDNDVFRSWYVSALGWTEINGTPYPEYVVRYAESSDGLVWRAYEQLTCIPLQGDEFGIGRPWVVKDPDKYRMWYSIRSRSEPYRIGYAESKDGLTWGRKDGECTITRSESGWDSAMVCYPCVSDINGQRTMFYNGNQHGLTGFGYATLETP